MIATTKCHRLVSERNSRWYWLNSVGAGITSRTWGYDCVSVQQSAEEHLFHRKGVTTHKTHHILRKIFSLDTNKINLIFKEKWLETRPVSVMDPIRFEYPYKDRKKKEFSPTKENDVSTLHRKWRCYINRNTQPL